MTRHWTLTTAPLDVATNQMILFSTSTKNLTTLLILLSTCHIYWKTAFKQYSFVEKIFQESSIYYEDTLNKAGYLDKVVYHATTATNQKNKNKNRQRNVLWFNLPCSKSVTRRIGQSFLDLTDIYFLKNHTLTRYSKKTLKRGKAECKTSTQS